MNILKKLITAIFISITMLAAAPAVMAAEEGSTLTLVDVIDLAEQTIAAMEADEEKATVLALLKETKQASKSIIISGPADLPRSKANMRIKKSRKAYRAGDKEKALQLAEEGLALYKAAKAKHFD